ncbi:low molecular weight phosphotyrosine protein phosphatase [Sphingomonas sp. CGMCC 1.13654]|uniref:protein-tyrosine-phosphatase n=1 Tax=Sphingomonas chungangi TaxID=2683589 RepID=A0A838L589_9SPHN|nr:low molecular weight protein-tyrosine-phosphatase [Sphingomonas chungangi]MBA2934070.1 low molecular weight phosphotyrosine protein phosphatase [Sphingomonas chungangi]MVW57111.1 low molecular weight phosphotyrosine protein phosphatase [Sphingomonas chungangi]
MAHPRILFVCMGNICRSPLAEAAFRHAAEEAGFVVSVDSAGTGGWHAGDPPDRRAQDEALRHGIDISGYRARQVARKDFRDFDLVLALDADNLADLKRMAPADGTAELGLLLDYAPGREGESVLDPYYGSRAGFARTWADVEAAAGGLVGRLQAKASQSGS